MHKRRNTSGTVLTLKVLDVVAPFALLYALVVINGVVWGKAYAVTGVLASILLFSMLRLFDAYRPWQGAQSSIEAFTIVRVWVSVVIGLLFLGWAVQSTEFYSRLVMGQWLLGVPAILVAQHLLMGWARKWLYKKGHKSRRAIIFGAGDLGNKVARKIELSTSLGLDLVGFVDDSPEIEKKNLLKPVLGHGDELIAIIEKHRVDTVFLALPMPAEERLKEVFGRLQDSMVSVMLVPDLFIFDLMEARHHDIGGMPVFSLGDTPFWGAYGMAKRLEDIVLTSAILFIFWPLLLLIALGVKLSSPGPVLFKQRRHGLGDQIFYVYKFRSMKVCEDGSHIRQARPGDPRVTRFGAFIRKTSLDELPQLFNVLKGEMSLVGPRPHAVAHNEEYRKLVKGYVWRHKVKPGITGWAQVNGWRGETDVLEKMGKRVEHDLWYISHWSVWLDIKIMIKTFWIVVSGKNAY